MPTMRFPSHAGSPNHAGAFSDRVLTFELPRRGRRAQRTNRSLASQRPGSMPASPCNAQGRVRTSPLPGFGAGSIAEHLIAQVGIGFFGASASVLFGDTPENWVRRAAGIESGC